jgi:hypothetical protein
LGKRGCGRNLRLRSNQQVRHTAAGPSTALQTSCIHGLKQELLFQIKSGVVDPLGCEKKTTLGAHFDPFLESVVRTQTGPPLTAGSWQLLAVGEGVTHIRAELSKSGSKCAQSRCTGTRGSASEAAGGSVGHVQD